jgi:Flp pilus assembly CpaE family ATPase
MNEMIIQDLATIASVGLVITLGIVFYLIRRIQRLEKKDADEKVLARIRLLEKELEHYIRRSQRRLDIFKRVIDGFDHVIQGIKGVIDEDDADSFDALLTDEERELIAHKTDEEAEIIHLDKQ